MSDEKARCGCYTNDIQPQCECWCVTPKSEFHVHLKDECTHENCLSMECMSCGSVKSPNHPWCEICMEEDLLEDSPWG